MDYPRMSGTGKKWREQSVERGGGVEGGRKKEMRQSGIFFLRTFFLSPFLSFLFVPLLLEEMG